MTSIAEFTLPPAEFPLGPVFETNPEATLDLDRVVPSNDTVMPYFWVFEPEEDLAGVLSAFEDVEALRTVVLMDDLGDRGLFRAEWRPEFMGIMRAIEEAGVTVVSASGSKDGWTFELRAPAGERFAAFQAACRDLAVPVTLARLRHLSETDSTSDYDLTAEQREALVLAFEEGYYDEPREMDQAALASRLGITRQALAARLRRGYRNLLANTVARRGDGR